MGLLWGRAQLIPSSQLQRVRELGRGTYATVYLGSWRGAAVAIKQMHQSVFEGTDGKQQLEVRFVSNSSSCCAETDSAFDSSI